MGEEPNHTTARKPGPLEIIQYSLERPVVNEREGEYTDKKENLIFLIYKEIHNGAVIYDITASSYMGKYLRISSYISKPFLIYDFATAPL